MVGTIYRHHDAQQSNYVAGGFRRTPFPLANATPTKNDIYPPLIPTNIQPSHTNEHDSTPLEGPATDVAQPPHRKYRAYPAPSAQRRRGVVTPEHRCPRQLASRSEARKKEAASPRVEKRVRWSRMEETAPISSHRTNNRAGQRAEQARICHPRSPIRTRQKTKQ